jgi:ligand-binding SRPBCC domain-containing protein
MHSLDQTQRIDAPIEAVFAFFSDPSNLACITPPWLSFRIHGAMPRPLGEGSRIEYRIRWAIFRLRWVTRITSWRPTAEFQDVQERGPYKTWIHTHRFNTSGSAVIMEDHVEYALPFGLLGSLVHALSVRRQLQKIFDYRRHAIARFFPGAASEGRS